MLIIKKSSCRCSAHYYMNEGHRGFMQLPQAPISFCYYYVDKHDTITIQSCKNFLNQPVVALVDIAYLHVAVC